MYQVSALPPARGSPCLHSRPRTHPRLQVGTDQINRQDKHKYVKYLYETIIKLNYNLISFYELKTTETINNYLYFIKKNDNINEESTKDNINESPVSYISPIFNDKLDIVTYNDSKYYKSKHINLYFPIIDNIPVLLIENSLIIKTPEN